MKLKYISLLVLAMAIIAGSVAAIVVTNKREAIARAAADKAEAAADKAKSEARKAEADAAAEQAKAEGDKKAAVKAAEDRKAAEAERDRAKAEATAAAENRKAAEAARDQAKAEAQAAADTKAAEKEKAKAAASAAEQAKAEADAAALKAQTEADKLAREKLASEKVIAESKLYEQRQMDLEAMARELADFKRELDEREAALQPEKTIKDLAWVSMEDTVIGEDGTVQKQTKVKYLPENDKTLSPADRELAMTERLLGEIRTSREAATRARIVNELQSLYDRAIKDDRVTDANYYKKTLKTLYPDWEYKK